MKRRPVPTTGVYVQDRKVGAPGLEPGRFSSKKAALRVRVASKVAMADADPDLAATLAAWPRLTAEQRRDVRRLAETLAGG